MHRYRTHTCGDLSLDQVGQPVRLAGWVHRMRDHGGLLFVDLRDHYGLTQCVVTSEHPEFDAAQSLRLESVVCVTGAVRARSEDTINPNLATGHVEIAVEQLEVLSRAETLPLPVNSDADYPESTRLQYRYLDLRRERMHEHLVLRSKVIASLRRRMQEQGFLEIQTPILTASSPEGARDYLVPSRVHPGKFYALPQAPQIFKQLLMVAGVDRYFQIAPCFRDEEARADRSPGEFYQLDLEMAFVEQEDVFAAVEPVLHGLFEEFSDRAVTKPPFPRIPYSEAMLRYGTDKPDLRNPITMSDATALFADSDFQVFRRAIEKGAVVRAIPVAGIADRPRSFFDRLNDYARSLGAGGLAYVILGGESPKGPVAKFLGAEKLEKLRADSTGADVVFFVCEQPALAARYGGEVRTHLGEQLDLLSRDVYEFCWVVDFPLYEWDEDAKSVDFSHNPFSMPQGGMEALDTEDPLQILAHQYDIVCNGIELSSGAIRNHLPELMVKVFERVGYRREDLERRFPGLFNAFRYGAPPHGGLAPGVDRIVMLLADEPNLREVIPFPMNQHAQDLMMGAPSEVSPEQLAELHIRVVPPKRKR